MKKEIAYIEPESYFTPEMLKAFEDAKKKKNAQKDNDLKSAKEKPITKTGA